MRIKFNKLLQLLIILCVVVFPATTWADINSFEKHYAEFLKKYWRPTVRINTISTAVFDYSAMHRDAMNEDSIFRKIISDLEQVQLSELKSDDREKAFWINVYNFAAMRLVIDQYPVDSIRSLKISLIKYPWSKKAIKVGGQFFSLKQIEKEILLKKFNDPRIVFAVSCAAVSCPDRISTPFSGKNIDTQLDEMIRAFYHNPDKGLSLNKTRGVMTLSWILKKDRHLFGTKDKMLLAFIDKYLDAEIRNWIANHSVQLRFFDHDWSLNDSALADH